MQKIKPEKTFITHPDIEHYAENFARESELLKELVAETQQELEFSDMLCGPIVGGFLSMIVQMHQPRQILELGTFTGYSALMMMEKAAYDTILYTVDLNERYLGIAEKYFIKSPFKDRIKIVRKLARDAMIGFENESFDLIFVDADKINYAFYFEQGLALLRPSGLLIMDNVLWGGGVLDPQDDKSRAIHQANLLAAEDERVDHILLPIRDGIQLIRKR